MLRGRDLKRSLADALWLVFLTLPIMVIRINPLDQQIQWRWRNMALVGIGSFCLSLVGRWLLARQKRAGSEFRMGKAQRAHRWQAADGRWARSALPILRLSTIRDIQGAERRWVMPAALLVALSVMAFPWVVSAYQVNIMTTALMYVVLGLGLNIVVGLAGLLDLGYVAFYAVGAYSYALLNYHFGINFWLALPIGGLLGALCGILLGFPVLRLRGDYLAIVTLGFGEIIRLVLENWSGLSFGPSGIANIQRPGLFGLDLSFAEAACYLYYLMIALTLLTTFVVNRLHHSRIGRAWLALREDEVACQAMGIDKTRTKLTAFALGAFWAGMMGVMFAAKTTFINPASFTFLESAIILAIVVLGGMGSILGVIIAALILILLPEYLRPFAEYRMLLFGAVMVIMMIFRPQGIISNVRRSYSFKGDGIG